jgi:hypothetical protein
VGWKIVKERRFKQGWTEIVRIKKKGEDEKGKR